MSNFTSIPHPQVANYDEDYGTYNPGEIYEETDETEQPEQYAQYENMLFKDGAIDAWGAFEQESMPAWTVVPGYSHYRYDYNLGSNRPHFVSSGNWYVPDPYEGETATVVDTVDPVVPGHYHHQHLAPIGAGTDRPNFVSEPLVGRDFGQFYMHHRYPRRLNYPSGHLYHHYTHHVHQHGSHYGSQYQSAPSNLQERDKSIDQDSLADKLSTTFLDSTEKEEEEDSKNGSQVLSVVSSDNGASPSTDVVQGNDTGKTNVSHNGSPSVVNEKDGNVSSGRDSSVAGKASTAEPEPAPAQKSQPKKQPAQKQSQKSAQPSNAGTKQAPPKMSWAEVLKAESVTNAPVSSVKATQKPAAHTTAPTSSALPPTTGSSFTNQLSQPQVKPQSNTARVSSALPPVSNPMNNKVPRQPNTTWNPKQQDEFNNNRRPPAPVSQEDSDQSRTDVKPRRGSASSSPTPVNSASSATQANSINWEKLDDTTRQILTKNAINPTGPNFNAIPEFAKFYVIKSYSEDDVHKSIKYSIWTSTDSGNRRLDKGYRDNYTNGPIYLFFSVNASGQFCGVAQMMSPLDYSKKASVWNQEDKWNGQFEVKWIFIKDIPNSAFRHIRLTNNENKPVTNSRDTQEVLLEPGREILRIFKSYKLKTSILDDFPYYNKQEQERILASASKRLNEGGNGSVVTDSSVSSEPQEDTVKDTFSEIQNGQQPQPQQQQQVEKQVEKQQTEKQPEKLSQKQVPKQTGGVSNGAVQSSGLKNGNVSQVNGPSGKPNNTKSVTQTTPTTTVTNTNTNVNTQGKQPNNKSVPKNNPQKAT